MRGSPDRTRAVILAGTGAGQTPPTVLKNIAPRVDDPFVPIGRGELLGHSQMPVGDLRTCRAGGAFPAVQPGQRCVASARTLVADGKPDYIVTSHIADTPIFDPDPASERRYKAEAGRAYVFSGNLGPGFINFAALNDPTPNTFGRFGNPTQGGRRPRPRDDAQRGARRPVLCRADRRHAGTLFDVSFFDAAGEQALTMIADPDLRKESGFGTRVMPLGDLNDDGFLDFAGRSR